MENKIFSYAVKFSKSAFGETPKVFYTVDMFPIALFFYFIIAKSTVFKHRYIIL